MALWLGVALLCGPAAPAVWAQVAVPSLIPTPAHLTGSAGGVSAGLLTPNPAAMQWGAPSRVGLGGLEGDTSSDAGGDGELSGVFGGVRLVGERVSAAVEATSISGTGALGIDVEQRAIGFATRPLSHFTIGFSGGSQDFEDNVSTATIGNRTLGVTVRFWETIYLGAAYGLDELELKDKASGFTAEDDRDVFLYGAGLRSGGAVPLHLEYYRVERQPITVLGTDVAELNADVGVVEAQLWMFALGYRVVSTEERNGPEELTTDTQVYDIAWAPFSGLTIGYRLEREEQEDDTTGEVIETDLNALTLGWNF